MPIKELLKPIKELLIQNIMQVRPYIYMQMEELALEICQKQGWFSDYECADDLTALDKDEPHFKTAFDIAAFTYNFWSKKL